MKKLNSFVFYALVTPAIAFGASAALAQQSTDRHLQKEQSTTRISMSSEQKEADRKTMHTQPRNQNRGYMATVPAHGSQASNLIGADVRTSDDEDVGTVNDLLIDENGQIVAIIVGVGGFLGVGEKDVAIGWGNVTRTGNADDLQLQIDVTREDLSGAPKFAKRE